MNRSTASRKYILNLKSTERLYYKDSINRILKQNNYLRLKEEQEKELIKGMQPTLSKGSIEIIKQKRQAMDESACIYKLGP